ncbi:MAG: hypothetical protein ACMXYF_02175 [Candidatus Woesearchaeota archaeon]
MTFKSKATTAAKTALAFGAGYTALGLYTTTCSQNEQPQIAMQPAQVEVMLKDPTSAVLEQLQATSLSDTSYAPKTVYERLERNANQALETARGVRDASSALSDLETRVGQVADQSQEIGSQISKIPTSITIDPYAGLVINRANVQSTKRDDGIIQYGADSSHRMPFSEFVNDTYLGDEHNLTLWQTPGGIYAVLLSNPETSSAITTQVDEQTRMYRRGVQTTAKTTITAGDQAYEVALNSNVGRTHLFENGVLGGVGLLAGAHPGILAGSLGLNYLVNHSGQEKQQVPGSLQYHGTLTTDQIQDAFAQLVREGYKNSFSVQDPNNPDTVLKLFSSDSNFGSILYDGTGFSLEESLDDGKRHINTPVIWYIPGSDATSLGGSLNIIGKGPGGQP